MEEAKTLNTEANKNDNKEKNKKQDSVKSEAFLPEGRMGVMAEVGVDPWPS